MKACLLFQSESLLALDKPVGLSLATPPKEPLAAITNLWNALSSKERKSAGAPEGWALLHRLDVTTSGVVLLARAGGPHRAYSVLWQAGAVYKRYLALTWGAVEPASGRFSDPLAPDRDDRRKMRVHPSGKRAATRYRVLAQNRTASFVEVELETGRTHQVRVHFAHAGHPLLGDDFYGRLRDIPPGVGPEERRHLQPGRALLHAWSVALPETKFAPALVVTAPIPLDFSGVLVHLGFPAPDQPTAS